MSGRLAAFYFSLISNILTHGTRLRQTSGPKICTGMFPFVSVYLQNFKLDHTQKTELLFAA